MERTITLRLSSHPIGSTAAVLTALFVLVGSIGCSRQSPPAATTVSPAQQTSSTAEVVPVPGEFLSASDWAYLRDQRGGEGSGRTSIPSSVAPQLAAGRIAQHLAADPTLLVVDLGDDVGAGGESWSDARDNGGPPVFRAETMTVAAVCTVAGNSGTAWERLRPTGEYAVLLVDGNLAAGIVMRPAKKSKTWEYEVDQSVGNWGVIRAITAARRVASPFEMRVVRMQAGGVALQWAVFRFASGDVKSAWLNWGRPVFATVGATRLLNGVMYPQGYVFAPVRALLGD